MRTLGQLEGKGLYSPCVLLLRLAMRAERSRGAPAEPA